MSAKRVRGRAHRSAAALASPTPAAATSIFRGRALWLSLALVAITLLAYEGVRHFDFVAYDDPRYVSENLHVSAGLTWESVRWAFTTLYGPYWHPLTLLSHIIDVQLFGLNAGGHHVTNLLIHVVNAMLLY